MTNLPISGPFNVTAIYGQTGPYWKDGHKGIDLVCGNLDIYCTCNGVVNAIGFDADGWGQYVKVKDNSGRFHIFCHLVKDSVKVKKGQTVDRLTVLGTMGATGNVTGRHLHYQLNSANGKPMDPTGYLGIPNEKGSYNSNDYHIDQKIKDMVNVPGWAKEAVEKVVEAGYMEGDASGYFRPNSYLTRAEMAVIIQRLKNL